MASFYDANKAFINHYSALEASEYGVLRLEDKGIDVQNFLLNNMPLPFEYNNFSAVVFNQVIEHVEKDVGCFYINEIIRVLESGSVGIIQSPSRFCKIWNTDPNHIYCWKPYELYNEVTRHKEILSLVEIQGVPLEPWMFLNYDEKIIDTWHKNILYPKLKRYVALSFRILDKINMRTFKSDKLMAVSNITLVKK